MTVAPDRFEHGRNLPPAWTRFVSFPGELGVYDADGNVKVARTKATTEDFLRAQGWSEREIAHAVGGPTPHYNGRIARQLRLARSRWRISRR